MAKYRKDGTLCSNCDPSVPHPGRVFYAGRWRTPEQIDARRKQKYAREKERRALWTPERREKRRAQDRERYNRMSGLEYNLFLLRTRRKQAVARRKKREATKTKGVDS